MPACSIIEMQIGELLSRLKAAGAIDDAGEPSFMSKFRLHVVKRLTLTKIAVLDISTLRQLLCDFESSVHGLTVEEIAAIVTLLLFNIRSNPAGVLTDLHSSGLAD